MNVSDKTKRFGAFLVSFLYPALVLMGAGVDDATLNRLGVSGGTRNLLVAGFLLVPTFVLIYFNIKLTLGLRTERGTRSPQPVIHWKDECLSAAVIGFLIFVLVGLFGLLDSQAENVHRSIINIPSLLVMGLCCFAFMLIMNGGHALRWLYHNKSDSLIRYNHHLKAGSAYGFAGMLGTGIGLVQIVGGIENIEFVLPATGITILTSLYGLFFFSHHLICRMWIYAHDEDVPCLTDLNGIFVSVGPAVTSVVLIVLWGVQSFSDAEGGHLGWLDALFSAFGVSDKVFAFEVIQRQLLPIALGLGIFLVTSFSVVSLFLRRKTIVRAIHESTWLEFMFTMGSMYLISLLAISASAFNMAEAGLAYASIGIVMLGFYTGIGMCHVYLNFQGRWADVGVIAVKQGHPNLLNYFHAPFFWNLTALAAATMGGSMYRPGYILLGVVVLFLVGQAQFKRNRLESIIGAQTEQLQRDKVALETLDQQKTQFFQTISHELRTPLTLIMSPLERRLEANPGQEELLIASSNAKRLLRLVNQLLDFQKASAGRFELNLRPRSLRKLVMRCADYFRSAASGRNLTFSVTQSGEPMDQAQAMVVVQVDTDAFEKVVMNFLSNALKYTPPGGEIELGFVIRDEKVRIFVRDSGPGIPAEAHAGLFEIFTQVDGSTTREFEGTGIGLALCKDLSEGMGGQVGVESAPGKGSTFWAEFPQVFEDAEDEFQEASDKSWLVAGEETALEESPDDYSEWASGEVDLILVVDDNPDMRRMVKASTQDMGYRVVTAEDGLTGLEAVREHRPDLVVSDWMMPNMSGPEMVAAIREDEELRGIPVVMLTAKSDDESKLVGKGVGADAFLGKPFNQAELGTTIRNLLQLKSGEKEIKRLNEYLTESVCKRYLPAELVQEILDGKLSMEQPAQLRHVTILFSDLKGFTATSERLGPEGISEILNEYLTVMNEVIFEYGGTIDKFIGDAIMVIFGAPKDMEPADQARRATECALAMNRAMRELAGRWAKFDATHLCMRIGIHQGPAVVGNFGSKRRSDYTCIGPTVNFAARIESVAEPGRVFVSSAVQDHLAEEAYEPAGSFKMKGLENEQSLVKLVG